MKNNVNQTFSVPIYLHCMDKRYNNSQWDLKLFGCQHSLKCSLLYCIEDIKPCLEQHE